MLKARGEGGRKEGEKTGFRATHLFDLREKSNLVSRIDGTSKIVLLICLLILKNLVSFKRIN